MCRQGGSKCELDVYQRYNNTRCVFSRECALFGAHVDDEQVPKISSEISPNINDKQLGRLNSYGLSLRSRANPPIIDRVFGDDFTPCRAQI